MSFERLLRAELDNARPVEGAAAPERPEPGKRTLTMRVARFVGGRLPDAEPVIEPGRRMRTDHLERPILRAATGAVSGDGASFRRHVTESAGRQLPGAEVWAQRFGHRLDHVRIHDDAPAQAAAAAVGARAFTQGAHVYFAGGELRTDSADGDRLLAHELAHVVQHDRGAVGDVAGVSAPGDAVERDADAIAEAALATTGGLADGWTIGSSAGTASPAPVLRSEGYLHGSQLSIVVDIGAEESRARIDHHLELTPEQTARFAADPALANQFAEAVEAALHPGGRPAFESTEVLWSAAITSRLQQDLPHWLDAGALPTTTALLAQRDRDRRSLQLLHDVEVYLQQRGFAPGSIDWVSMLPRLLENEQSESAIPVLRSHREQYLLFLRALLLEASRRPPSGGRVPIDRLEAALADYVWQLPNREFGSAQASHSEAFLWDWCGRLEQLRYVPEGFDPERFQPFTTGADVAAERERIMNAFERDEMPERVTHHVLDLWAASGQSAEGYLARLDLDGLRSQIVERLAQDLMARARSDEGYAAIIRDAVHDEGRYRAIRALVASGRAAQMSHDGLAGRMASSQALTDEEARIAADPAAHYAAASALATTLHGFLSALQQGRDVDAALAAAVVPEHPGFAQAATLLTLVTDLLALRALRQQHDADVAQRLRDRLNLRYDTVAHALRTMWERADHFIEHQYLPALERLVIRRLTDNRDELEAARRTLRTRGLEVAAEYRVVQAALEDIARRLETGEATEVELDGQILTRQDVAAVKRSAEVLKALAGQLETVRGRSRKIAELDEAIEAFDRVRAGVRDDPPERWGPEIHRQVRAELGIGELPEGTTYGQALSGRVAPRDNPFLSRALTRWRFQAEVDSDLQEVAAFAALGLLTAAQLLAPGVAQLVLAFVDIAVAIGGAAHGVVDARRTLDLALLDTHLELRGVSVPEAREALHHAWIGLALSIAFGAGVTALSARCLVRGTGPARLRTSHVEAAMQRRPEDVAVLLQEYGGDAGRLDIVLGHLGHPERRETLHLARELAALGPEHVGRITQELGGSLVRRLRDRGASVPQIDALARSLGGEGTQRALAALATHDELLAFCRFAELDGPAARRLADALATTPRTMATLVVALDAARLRTMVERATGLGVDLQRLPAMVEHIGAQRVDSLLARTPDEFRAAAEAARLEAMDGAHSLARHGPDIDDADLQTRIRTGTAPDGHVSGTRNSTRFGSYRDYLETRQAALDSFQREHGIGIDQPLPGGETRAQVVLDAGHPVGEGFRGRQGTSLPGLPKDRWSADDPMTPAPAFTKTSLRWNGRRWKVMQHFPHRGPASAWDIKP
jgi:hypothetical protein